MAKAKSNGSAALGFEEKLRGHMDASEYKHVVLRLVFLKYISDSFMEHHDRLSAGGDADAEDRDEFLAEGVFWTTSSPSMISTAAPTHS